MNDLISRQAVVDVIEAKSDEIYKTKQSGATFPHDDFFQGMAYAADIVANMPSEPQWIPCSERLPEEKQDVLLAFRHNMVVGFWEDILNDGGQAWYANSGNGWFTGTESVDDDGFPIAWMPLPECYRGEKDGE